MKKFIVVIAFLCFIHVCLDLYGKAQNKVKSQSEKRHQTIEKVINNAN